MGGGKYDDISSFQAKGSFHIAVHASILTAANTELVQHPTMWCTSLICMAQMGQSSSSYGASKVHVTQPLF